jgi:predicted HAD superfamily Cof-like phosphohydrolase
MSKFIDDIRQFHEKFDLRYDGPARRLPDGLAAFRCKFLLEETKEYTTASREMEDASIDCDILAHDQAMENAFDALIDLVYVALGTAYLHGFDFDAGWDRVHAANMKKVRAASATDSKRNSRHDVVKPEGWEPPVLKDLLFK